MIKIGENDEEEEEQKIVPDNGDGIYSSPSFPPSLPLFAVAIIVTARAEGVND